MPSSSIDDVKTLKAQVPPLPHGTVVAINMETGAFVTGCDETEALKAFAEKFDWGVPASLHVVQEPSARRQPNA